jgi:hypothetical protein
MPRSSSKRKRPRPPPSTTTTDEEEQGVIANNNRRAALAAQRRAILTHGTNEKRQELRLRMHLERAKRSLAQVRNRLEKWDAVVEAERMEKEAVDKQPPEQPDETTPPTKKMKKFGGRPSNDPSTWQLKGAARPAAQVYDFDVRYVDQYVNDHVQAHESARRQVNRLADHSTTSLSTCPVGRTFLSLLMQVGHLSAESHLFRPAKEAWYECMQHDDGNITTAQECLLQLYITRRQFQDAYELGVHRRKSDDTNNETDHDATTSSAVVCYTTALAAFALHHGVGTAVVSNDETTTKGNSKRQKNKNKSSAVTTTTRPVTNLDEQQVQDYMTQAIRNNVFLAYYLVHYEIFHDVMECQDELEQADDDNDDTVVPPPQSLLEEAIEYGHSDQVAVWHEVGAHHLLARILQSNPAGGINDWQGPLDRLLVAHQQQQQHQSSSTSKVDLVMFAGMFRTAMEMVASQQQRHRR